MKARTIVTLGALLAGLLAIPAPARACSWPAVIEADTINVAYPDTNATYWMTRYAAVPGARIRIEGTYPDARYFSFHAYDEAQRPIGSLADLHLAPDDGSANPFSDPLGEPRGTYTAFIEFTPAPGEPAPNTMYTGAMNDGTPNPAGTILYRVYVPRIPGDLAGSVPLPRLTLEKTDGAVALPLGACEPLPPSTGSPLTNAIRSSSFPNEVPRAVPWAPAQDPPRFVKFYALSTNTIDRFPPNPATDPLPRDTSGGFLSNQHINYLFALTSRSLGEVFAMRAKAPTAPDTRAGEHATTPANMRYWSICQNSFTTQRFVQCLADFEVVLDEDGWFTVAISDPDDRPASAANWLPWGGPHYDGNVIYRHMLPSPAFDGAIQRVPYRGNEAAVMGEYYPEAAYCSAAAFDAGTCFD